VSGATTPIRLVSSAKSWLSHPSVDRRAAILPHDAPEEVARVSPLALAHRLRKDPLEPAADDERVRRMLTEALA
jgi:hypothetical protein